MQTLPAGQSPTPIFPPVSKFRRFFAKDGSLVALADCDTFYASCERVIRPDLKGKPVVVLSNNDGCLVAMSREAKELGFPFGAPYFKVRRQIERAGAAVFSSNYTLYGDLSKRVIQTLRTVTPYVDVYSIDEAFLELRGALAANALSVAQLARYRVGKWVGLPISIGIAPTRVLAKIATRKAKKLPEGIFDLSSCNDLDGLLDGVAVGDIWGIGSQSAKKLQARGIMNARQLRDADAGEMKKLLTVGGLNIVLELRGIPSIFAETPKSHQCIVASRSLGYRVNDLSTMKMAIAMHAERAAEKLRRKHLAAKSVGVWIQTPYYDEHGPKHEETLFIGLPRQTIDTAVIIRTAQQALERIFRPDCGYNKAMVLLGDLITTDADQGDLRDCLPLVSEQVAKRKTLMELIDKMNRRRKGIIQFAAQGLGPQDWHMSRRMLSPCWSTDLSEIPVAGDLNCEKIAEKTGAKFGAKYAVKSYGQSNVRAN